MLRFTCPNPTCKTVQEARPEQAGTTIVCAKCGTLMRVPGGVSAVRAAPAPSSPGTTVASPALNAPGSAASTAPDLWTRFKEEARAVAASTWAATILLGHFLSAWVRNKVSKNNAATAVATPAPFWLSDPITQRRVIIGFGS